MNDIVIALAERLRRTFAVWRDHAYVDLQSLDVDGFTLVVDDRDAADVLAREALAVVAERLPTREEVARFVAGYCDLASHGITTAFACAACGRCRNEADALLRDLRGRLGVKS